MRTRRSQCDRLQDDKHFASSAAILTALSLDDFKTRTVDRLWLARWLWPADRVNTRPKLPRNGFCDRVVVIILRGRHRRVEDDDVVDGGWWPSTSSTHSYKNSSGDVANYVGFEAHVGASRDFVQTSLDYNGAVLLVRNGYRPRTAVQRDVIAGCWRNVIKRCQ